MVKQTLKEKIRQRRWQMLVHSCLYYEMDESIVDDHTWQRWADELARLQDENPKECEIHFYDKEFKGWTGSSGYDLPLRDSRVWTRAQYILRIHQKNNCVQADENSVEYTGNLEDFM